MRRNVIFAWLILAAARPASATWSVVAVDRSTGTVVIASATCVPQAGFVGFKAKDLRDIQAIVVPGKAVAAAQANVDATRTNQRLIFAELQKGTPPDQIIAALKQDPQIASRQFGIVDLEGRTAGFTGETNGRVALDRHGRIDGTQIYYSIQGNILRGDPVVTDGVRALTTAKGDLADRVMAALEAGDAGGGDSRCSCESRLKVNAPCTAKTSHVAYILRAEKGDKSGSSYNDGDYALYLSATDQDITPQEDANPVKTLRMRYDAWKKQKR
jgi:uncharacterized Ntn-hydrolase superfamily protein